MNRSYHLNELATAIEGTVDRLSQAQDGIFISGVSSLKSAMPHQAAWLSHPRYRRDAASSQAGVVLATKGLEITGYRGPVIRCKNIQRSVALLLHAFSPPPTTVPVGIHSSAVVASTAMIGAGCRIGPNVVIESDVLVGANTTLHAGVYLGSHCVVGEHCELFPHVSILARCQLGNRVTIHASSVIGAQGFGYYVHEGSHRPVPHIGNAVIGNDVEIGSCTTIDRAKFGSTLVGEGTKIDNLCHIAHNCEVGRHCVIAGQTALSGSTRTGDYCVFGGRSGSFDNVTIGNKVTLTGMAVATHDIPDGEVVGGTYSEPLSLHLRVRATLKRLPDLLETVRQLTKRVQQLETANHKQASDD